MEAWVDVAVLTGTKTLDGRFVVRSAPGLPFLLFEGCEAFFVPPVTDAPRSGFVKEAREACAGDYLVRFDSVADKTTAGKLLGCHVLLKKSDLDIASAAFVDQSLVSYDVVDCEMGHLGKVCSLEQMPGQYLLQVDSDEGDSFSIPFVDEFVLGIDTENKVISVDIPVGLLRL